MKLQYPSSAYYEYISSDIEEHLFAKAKRSIFNNKTNRRIFAASIYGQLLSILSEEDMLESISKCEASEETTNVNNIETLKKRIKYCKNPMELKMLNRTLNQAYKENKRKGRI